MKKENTKIIVMVVSVTLAILLSAFFIMLCYGFVSDNTSEVEELKPNILILGYSFICISVFFIIYHRVFYERIKGLKRHGEEENTIYDKNLLKLNRIISYNKQRNEIEQEIAKLTRELMQSDVAQYVDINRLAFSGQNPNLEYSGGLINFDNFIKQFGLQKEDLIVKEGTAAFLTPFDTEGNRLFNICQSILGRSDIFLRKTDNYVEKDDILMNIVLLIIQSEFILVNIDGRNPNVYYELGIAHTLGKPTILLSKAKYTEDDIGFDIRQKKIILYDNFEDLEVKLLSQISMLKRK